MKKKCSVMITLISALGAQEFEPMVVLSSKLESPRYDEGIAVDVIDEQKRDVSPSVGLNGLSSLVPNTHVSGIGGRSDATISMRGVSNYVTLESSVGLYVDGAPVPFSYGYGAVDLADAERIEVLKGPQGTQFGKGAESGVINIYTPSPTTAPIQKLRLEAGSYNQKSLYASGSGPAAGDLSYALAVTKSSRDGFTTNTYYHDDMDSRDMLGIHAKLHYDPKGPLHLALNYSGTTLDDGGSPFKINTKKDPFKTSEPYRDYMRMQNDLLSAVARYETENDTLTYTATYAKEDIQKSDYVALSGGVVLDYDIRIEEMTQEMRLNHVGETSEWVIGGFYSDRFRFHYDDTNTLQALPLKRNWSIELPDVNKALFGQMNYWLNDAYAVTAGVRYQTTERAFVRDFSDFDGSTSHADVDTTWSHTLPMLSFSYYGADNAHTYLTYSKGYRPGGYGYRTLGSNPEPYKPQITDSFELGHKNRVSKQLTLTGSLFYNRIDDLRVVTFADDLSSTVANADKAHAYGAEFDCTYRGDDLYLFANAGATSGTYDKLTNNGMDHSGNRIIDTPDFTASAGLGYALSEAYRIKSSVRYVGMRYYDSANSVSEKGYTVVNMAMGYQSRGWDAELYAANLTDTRYVDFMIATPSNNYYHFGAPRTVGLKATILF